MARAVNLPFLIGRIFSATLVEACMGGMCLGSVVLPRLISATRHPLRVYALLESGIGPVGILILFVFRGLPRRHDLEQRRERQGL
jgi:hypothetical protein